MTPHRKALSSFVPLLVLVAFSSVSAGPAVKWVAAVFMEKQGAAGLRWIPYLESDDVSYRVLRRSDAETDYRLIATTQDHQHIDTTVEPGRTYTYRIQTLEGTAVAAESEARHIRIIDKEEVRPGPPPPPRWKGIETRYAGFEFECLIHLEWEHSPSAGSPAIAFNLYRRELPDGKYLLLTSENSVRATDYKVPKNGGIAYGYALTALDMDFKESARSAELRGGCFFPGRPKGGANSRLDEAVNRALNGSSTLENLVSSLAMGTSPPSGELDRELNKGLLSEDPDTRWLALAGLGLLRGSDAQNAFRTALDLPAEEMSRKAVSFLCRRDDKEAEGLLIAVLENHKSKARLTAARCLGVHSTVEVIDTLIGHLDDEEIAVREGALESLRRLTGQMLRGEKSRWEEWWSANRKNRGESP